MLSRGTLGLSSAVVALVVAFLSTGGDALVLSPSYPMRSERTAQRHAKVMAYTTLDADKTAARVQRCLAAKEASGLSFDELAAKLGLTNVRPPPTLAVSYSPFVRITCMCARTSPDVCGRRIETRLRAQTYTCQLLLGQAQLKPDTADNLKAALPALDAADVDDMQGAPMRGFDDEILKEPNVYRTYEAITHYGLAIKTLINEQCGDGIMSAIDFFMDVGTTTGKLGEKRVVITFNGKFLPFIEQVAANNGVPSPRD